MKKKQNLLLSLAIVFSIAACTQNPNGEQVLPSVNAEDYLDLSAPGAAAHQVAFAGTILGKKIEFGGRSKPGLVRNTFGISSMSDPQAPRPATVEVWANIERFASLTNKLPIWEVKLFMPSVPKEKYEQATWEKLFAPGAKTLGDAKLMLAGELPREGYGFVFSTSDIEIMGAPNSFYLKNEPGTRFEIVSRKQIPAMEGWLTGLEVTYKASGQLYEGLTHKPVGLANDVLLVTRFYYQHFGR
jgi:hypothetical protein